MQGIMKPAEGATEAGAQAILDYLKTLTKQMLAGRGRRRKTSSVESGHRFFGELDQPDRGLLFHRPRETGAWPGRDFENQSNAILRDRAQFLGLFSTAGSGDSSHLRTASFNSLEPSALINVLLIRRSFSSKAAQNAEELKPTNPSPELRP